MEAQIHTLREELIQVNAQRKQQLAELSLIREEEKQRISRDHEAAMNKLRADSEKRMLDIKKTSVAETEMALEKVSQNFIYLFTKCVPHPCAFIRPSMWLTKMYVIKIGLNNY